MSSIERNLDRDESFHPLPTFHLLIFILYTHTRSCASTLKTYFFIVGSLVGLKSIEIKCFVYNFYSVRNSKKRPLPQQLEMNYKRTTKPVYIFIDHITRTVTHVYIDVTLKKCNINNKKTTHVGKLLERKYECQMIRNRIQKYFYDEKKSEACKKTKPT